MNPNTEDFIPFSRPVMGLEEEQAVLSVLRSGWLTTGPEAKAFEKEFADYTGAEHCLAVNSATSGLHLALEALGIGPGDRVAVPSYTFTATAEVIRYLGADPVFVDSRQDHYNMDMDKLASVCDRLRIKAVIPVHLAGRACDMEALGELKRRWGFFVVEDAAHAFPVRTRAGFVGTLGDAGVYSFYANKTITTGEGGMVATSDAALAARMRLMRLHGIDRDAFARFTSRSPAWEYDICAPGFKYNMSDLCAAIGRVQLRKAQEFLARRRELAQAYNRLLKDTDFLMLPEETDDHAWHLYTIHLKPAALSIDRDEFLRLLGERGVGTSVHYIPLHKMTYYKNAYGLQAEDYPRAEGFFRTVISLPLFPSLTEQQLHRVALTVLDIGRTYAAR